MDRVPMRLSQWWLALDSEARKVHSWLVLIAMGYTAHYLVYAIPQPFFIEDAGISFAYARNFVDGEGFATYAGGPRVEGFSNPSWTFLIALLYAIGVPTFTASKLLGWAFGVATLPLSWALVRRALPERTQAPLSRDKLALIAPAMLAASVQFTVWNSSGLENSLFCFLLALGMWRCVVELEDGGRPWSALVFFLLCASRPEGIMYALIAGGIRGWHALFSAEGRAQAWSKRLAIIAAWAAVLVVPLMAFHAWRYWYFAWEFPNTYYAKLGTGRSFRPFLWDKKGWKYIGEWFGPHGGALWLPLIVMGLSTYGKRLRWMGAALVGVLALLLATDGPADLDAGPAWFELLAEHWVHARVWTLAACVPVIWGFVLASPRWRSRGLLWLNAAAGVFFVVYVGGDWMKAHRWFNLFSVPLTGVLAVGIAELMMAIAGTRPQQWMRTVAGTLSFARTRPGIAAVVGAALTLGWIANETRLTMEFAVSPETTVRDIHRRVKYMSGVQKQLDVEHITLLDVDMGAHMYFTDWEIVDIAGLVDVPMARHSDFNKKFLREYLFKERLPDFAHVHGGWARASRIHKMKEFKNRYIEIPGYPIGKRKKHIGNHVNKALFVKKDATETPLATFETGIQLVTMTVPSPLVQPGAELFIETNWRTAARKSPIRAEFTLTAKDGTTASTIELPGYGWYPPKKWKKTETVNGKFRMLVPKSFPRGPATVSIRVLGEGDDDVYAVLGDATDDGMDGSPTIPVDIGDAAAVAEAAKADRLAALNHATDGECERVWPAWKNAIRHGPFRSGWIARHEQAMRDATAECYAARALTADDHGAKLRALMDARKWNHRLASVESQTRPLAEALEERGDKKWAEGKLNAAYEAFRSSVELDPRRSWARRKAEDVRDLRLKITRPGRKKKRG